MRYTQIRIEHVGFGYRSGGTGVNAKRTSTALIRDFLSVIVEFKVQQQLANEYPRAVLFSDQVCVLANPTYAGPRGPGFIHSGLNIHADLAFCVRPLLLDPGQETSQLVADHLVIIIAPGIS